MGGGGGSGRSFSGDLEGLAETAKKELEKGGKPNTFLSFDFDDVNEVNLLRGQAKNENSDIDFSDYSVKEPINSKKSEYIKRQITDRIRKCSTVVVYVSENTSKSGWVDWEVTKSLELSKKVIAVHKGETAPSPFPSCISDNNINVVAWKDLKNHL